MTSYDFLNRNGFLKMSDFFKTRISSYEDFFNFGKDFYI